jgi:hypothetical protein
VPAQSETRTKLTRANLLKIAAWTVLGGGLLILIADFGDSDHNFAAFRHALKDSLLVLGLGGIFLSQAYQAKRTENL